MVKYIMGFSQAYDKNIIVYADCYEDAVAKFQDGEFSYETLEAPKTAGSVFEINIPSLGYVKAVCNEDCDENAGGLWVELFKEVKGDVRQRGLYEDERFDDMCVHIGDCDLNDENEVENVIREYLYDIWF